MIFKREHFKTKIGFLMATVGSAIGLGNLWRFPYLTGEYSGGIFVGLYLFFTLLIGLPMFIGELIIGRATQKGPIKAYEALSSPNKYWYLIGWLNIFAIIFILAFYSVVSGWVINYIFMSLMQFIDGKTPSQIQEIFNILYLSTDIKVFFHFLFIFIISWISLHGVRKGIEYWCKILTPAMIFILICLFIYTITLPGFNKAFQFLIFPDFSKLSASLVFAALGMSLFTLSVGIGVMITYGSYMKNDMDIPKTSLIVVALTALSSLLGSFVIFSITFTFNLSPEEGPGLVFKTLPLLFSKLPGTFFLSALFFILFLFTAITSAISLLETLVVNLMERFLFTRKKAILLSSSIAFLLGIPAACSGSLSLFKNWKNLYGKDFLFTIDYITANWFLPLGAFLTSLFISIAVKKSEIRKEFFKGTTFQPFVSIWLFLITFFVPIALILIFLQNSKLVDFSYLVKKVFGG